MFKTFKNLFSVLVIGLLMGLSIVACDNSNPPAPASLTDLRVMPAESDLLVGTVQQYTATAYYSDETIKDVTADAIWSTSDATIATIDSSGVANTLDEGTAVISAEYASVSSNQATLTVAPVALTISQVVVQPGDTSLPAGLMQQYTAMAVMSNDEVFDITNNTETVWSSTDTGVATTDAAGLVTTVSAGTADIKADFTYSSGSLEGSAVLTVTVATLTSIEIIDTRTGTGTPDEFIVGTAIQAKAMGTFSDASVKDITNDVTWTAATTTISVNQEGLISALSAGAAQVTAGYTPAGSTEVTDDATGTVVDATLVSLDIFGLHTAPAGVSISLTAFATYDNGAEADVTTKVDWSSHLDGLALSDDIDVDQDGVVTAKRGCENCNALIKAKFGAETARHTVRFSEQLVVGLEIQDNYTPDGTGTVISDTDQAIQLVDAVSYPDDTNGLSEGAYYPTLWVVYADGSRGYVGSDVFWWSDNQLKVYLNYLQGAYIFGKELAATANISAYFGGFEATFKVNVTNAVIRTLQSIELRTDDGTDVTDTTIDIADGFETWVTAYGHYSNGDVEDINSSAYFSSSDPKVAFIGERVDTNIHGRSVGTAVISAEWQGVTGSLTANITPLTLQSIELQKGSSGSGEVISLTNPLELTVGGAEEYVTAWGHYDDGSFRYINAKVFWTEEDKSIARVGFLQSSTSVKGINPGSTQISAILDEVLGSAQVNVQ